MAVKRPISRENSLMLEIYARVCGLAAVVLALGMMAGCPPVPAPNPDPNAVPRVFESLRYYPAGDQPFSVAVADLDGDGRNDIVTANEESNTVSVLLANASGGFVLHQEYPVGEGPVAVAVADFDGDGRLDLATANSMSNDVSVLLKRDDGYADEIRLALAAGSGPAHLVAADLDADGAQDLAVANQAANTLSLIPGAGDGTFGAPVDLPVGLGPRHVIATVLGAGPRPVLISVNRESNDLTVLRANGAGGFDFPESVPVGTNPRAAALIGLDGGGFPGLVVSNPGSGDLSLLRGAAGGTFLPQTRVPLNALPTRIAVGDFNRDGRDDVAVVLFDGATGVSLNELAVLYGDGTGGLGNMRLFGGRGATIDVAAAEVSGDSFIDLVTANSDTDDISVMRGRGDGGFETDERFRVGARPRVVVAGYFNEDSKLDLAVLNQDSGDISILIGNGDATFRPQTVLAFTGTPRAMVAGDLDGDGHLDLAVTDLPGGMVSVYLGRGNGTFRAQSRYSTGGSGGSPRSIAIGDINGDGNPDLVVGNAASDSLAILIGDGEGGFAAPVTAGSALVGNFPLSVQVGDLDGDGADDVVFVNGLDPSDEATSQSPRVRTLFGKGDGGLEARTGAGPYAVDPDPRDLVLGDLNGDGRLDALTVHPGRKSVNHLLGRGAGKLFAGVAMRAGNSPNAVAMADINEDRFQDIVTTNEEDSVTVLLGRGGTTFSSLLIFPVGTRPAGGILADFNGDRRLEAVVANRDAGTVSVLRGRR
jgi:hypothetical protein